MFDLDIHETALQIGKLQERQRMLRGVQSELINYGLEGMNVYHMTAEYEYMEDVDNTYFDVIVKWYGKGWSK